MKKHLQNIALLVVLSFVTLFSNAQVSKNSYNSGQWRQTNATAMLNLESSQLETEIPFKPVLINEELVTTKCKLVEFYDKAIYYDIERRMVLFVDDKARSDYYLIFVDATNVNMGANSYELFIECNVSPTKSYDVVYNLVTNKARKVAEGDMTLLRRFATMKPHIYYTQPRERNTKMLHDYFKALSEENYVAAQEMRMEICRENNALYGNDVNWNNVSIFNAYPLMELGEAMLMNYPANYSERSSMMVKRDPYKAYSYVTQVYKRDTLLTEANSVLLSGDIRLSVDQIKTGLEKELLRLARLENTEQAYDRFLMALYNSPLRKEARVEQEALVYPAASTATTEEALLRYLNKYRGVDERHYNFVEQRLFKVAFDNLQPTEAACKEYVSRFLLSPYSDQVRKRMSEYAYNEIKPNAASCRYFLENYGDSPHSEEVWYKLYEYAFNELPDDIDACNKYIELYPGSEYCDQVDKKILKIKYNNAVKANTVEAYDAFIEENGYNTYTGDVKQRRDQLLGVSSSVQRDDDSYDDGDDYEPARQNTYRPKPKVVAPRPKPAATTPRHTTTPKPAATTKPKQSNNAASEFERMLKGKKN